MSQRIHLDATPGLFHQVLHCHQGDVGRQFEIAVVTRDGYEIPSGATFKIQATKPSGLGFTVTGTAANNIISFTSTEDMTSEAGEIPTQLEIKSGNDVIYASNFLLVCEKNTHPESVTDGSPEEIISEITLLVERAESAASTAGADAAAAAQARVDEMMDYLPSEVANLKSDKVPYPINPDSKYGTSGQVLRTKGNGATEWASVGLPTDAQTAQAVSDWLDDHPEATTTVQDESLTEAKFTDALKLKTIKDYVTPQMFGAKGDGVHDDTEAIQNAIDSNTSYVSIFFPPGVYRVTSPITINRENTHIFGSGFASTILADNPTNAIEIAGLYGCSNITIRDLRLYGNNCSGGIDCKSNVVSFASFDHLIIENFTWYGFRACKIQEFDFNNCIFRGNYYHFWVPNDAGNYCTSLIFRGKKSYLGRSTHGAIRIEKTVTNLILKDVIVENNEKTAIVLVGEGTDVVIRDCYFENNYTNNVMYFSGTSAKPLKFTIDGCYFYEPNAVIIRCDKIASSSIVNCCNIIHADSILGDGTHHEGVFCQNNNSFDTDNVDIVPIYESLGIQNYNEFSSTIGLYVRCTNGYKAIELDHIPAVGTWNIGDYVRNTNPNTNNCSGWICKTAGTPGTWQAIPL